MRKMYMRVCQRYCPDGMSLSALAWRRALHGKPYWRNRIDGFWLLVFSEHNHSQSCFQREVSKHREQQ